MDEFRHWWLNEHAQKVLEQQGPMLERYIINIRNEIDGLPGAPQASFNWDGMAEEWFRAEEREDTQTLHTLAQHGLDVNHNCNEVMRKYMLGGYHAWSPQRA